MDSDIWCGLAAFLFCWFRSSDSYSTRQRAFCQTKKTAKIPDNLLADDDLNPDADVSKPSILSKDVTWVAYILFGIPALLVIGLVAMMMTIVDGGGAGTFMGIFLLLGALAYLKIRFM